MRFLIIDDDASYGALLASACKHLGHRGLLFLDAQEAIKVANEDQFDAVFLDLAMPAMSGFEVEAEMRQSGITKPIAYCVGTCSSAATIEDAKTRGPILPKVWTHRDLKQIISSLRTLANQSALFPLSANAKTEFGEPTQEHSAPPPVSMMPASLPHPNESIAVGSGPMRLPATFRAKFAEHTPNTTERIRIGCKTWDQVRRLCVDVTRGIRSITVRARSEMTIGQEVTVSLSLPDEMVLSIKARVLDKRSPQANDKCPYQIELLGMSTDQVEYLLNLCDQALDASRSHELGEQPRISWAK